MRSVVIGLLFSVFFCAKTQAQSVLVSSMHIDDNIDARTVRYVKVALAQAEEKKTDYLVLEMNTFGGALDAADKIRSAILNYRGSIYVFINKNAASAGALIALACDSIYMAEGASIGAATVVTATGEAAPDKYQSYMRAIMRSTAQAKGRNPDIAEAMVDENLVVDSVSVKGEVITFSTQEAIQYGFCEGTAQDIDEIMQQAGINDYHLEPIVLSNSERVIAFFINPFISGILILAIMGGIYYELQTPGLGFPGALALLALVLYLVPYYVNGLAQHWEIILFMVGIALIALEIFVIPGFGVAGISGITLSLVSLILIMLDNFNFDFSFIPTREILQTIITVGMAAFGGMVLIFVSAERFPRMSIFKRITLQQVMAKEKGFSSEKVQISLLGKEGEVYSVLRPSGKVLIENEVYEAHADSTYLEKGTPVVVISEEGRDITVREIRPERT